MFVAEKVLLLLVISLTAKGLSGQSSGPTGVYQQGRARKAIHPKGQHDSRAAESDAITRLCPRQA